jgi:TonB family protein
MRLHLLRPSRLIARRAALALLVAAACLAPAPPATSQQNKNAQPPQSRADAGRRRFPVDQWATLNNRDEMEREIAARYPPSLRDSPVTDEVLLRFRVLSDGRVDSTSIAVVQTRNVAFAEPAAAVARRLRFTPAMANGRVVPIWTEFRVYFNLPGLPDFGGVTQGSIDQDAKLQNHDEVSRQIASRYPLALRDSGIAGSVLLRFKVSNEGTVDSASITMRQATDTAFVEAATLVVRQMRFTPAIVSGRPVQTWVTAPVHFTPRAVVGTPPDEGTYELSAVEVKPELRNRAEIERQIEAGYPRALLSRGVTGDVDLRFRILESGTVDPTSITVEMTTNPAFAEPATIMTRGMLFTPAKVGGRPVNVWVTIPIHFGFEDSPPARSDSNRTGTATPPPERGEDG